MSLFPKSILLKAAERLFALCPFCWVIMYQDIHYDFNKGDIVRCHKCRQASMI